MMNVDLKEGRAGGRWTALFRLFAGLDRDACNRDKLAVGMVACGYRT